MTVEEPAEVKAEETEEPKKDDVSSSLKWYVVHSFSGYEQRVAKFLEGQLARKYPEKVGKTLIPTEEITHRKSGFPEGKGDQNHRP